MFQDPRVDRGKALTILVRSVKLAAVKEALGAVVIGWRPASDSGKQPVTWWAVQVTATPASRSKFEALLGPLLDGKGCVLVEEPLPAAFELRGLTEVEI